MQTEKEMREAEVPTFETLTELNQYIDGLVFRDHDYGTCVYAMSMAATAAFNYVASRLGVTGFQASCADLDIIRRTRRIDGPFMLVKAKDSLFPQYDTRKEVDDFLNSAKQWLSDEAKKELANMAECNAAVHPNVAAHWRELANAAPDSTATRDVNRG